MAVCDSCLAESEITVLAVMAPLAYLQSVYIDF